MIERAIGLLVVACAAVTIPAILAVIVLCLLDAAL